MKDYPEFGWVPGLLYQMRVVVEEALFFPQGPSDKELCQRWPSWCPSHDTHYVSYRWV